VIDADGYRQNVGMIVANAGGRVLWARRLGRDSWQFPQGGIERDETPEQALYRELHEELGLREDEVEIMGCTQEWLRYTLPQRYRRRNGRGCIGQKQRWFLLRLDGCARPEFDHWKWVSYWHPAREVIYFKREVYRRALKELAPLLYGN